MSNSSLSEEVCQCFDEIKQVLLEMETEINCLFTCDPDDIDVCVERIEKYKEITDEIFADINEICREDETGELKKAAEPLTDRKDVSESFTDVFEKRQEINAVAYRIKNTIPMVQTRLQKSMEKTLEEIRKNNTSQSAQASRYFNAVNSTQTSSRLSQKNRTI